MGKTLIFFRTALILGCILSSFGCSSKSDSQVSHPPVLGEEAASWPLFEDGMSFGSPYDSIKGGYLPHNDSCLAAVDPVKDTSGDVYSNSFDYSYKMIETKEDIYTFINASYGTKAGILGSSKLALSMSNEYKHEEDSIYIVVASKWDGPVYKLTSPAIKFTQDYFKNNFPTYPDFVNTCGDSFVNQIKAGSYFYGMFKLTFSSTEDKNTAHASLSKSTLGFKSQADLNTAINVSKSSYTVTVTALIQGAAAEDADIGNVRDIDTFFTFITDHSAAIKKAIQDNDTVPQNLLQKGYAVGFQYEYYNDLLIHQYGVDNNYFGTSIGDTWKDLRPITGLYVQQTDAYNELDFIINNPYLFKSNTSQGQTLTSADLADLTKYRTEFNNSALEKIYSGYSGIEAVMLLCSQPYNQQSFSFLTDANSTPKRTGRGYCNYLYTGDPKNPGDSGCDTLSMCASLWNKLIATPETDRKPFFTTNIIEDGKIIDANGNVLLGLPEPVDEFPRDCAELQNLKQLKNNDTYPVYFMGDRNKPFKVYCDTASSPVLTYLTVTDSYLPAQVNNDSDLSLRKYNYTMNKSSGGTQYRGWNKYRIVTTSSGVAIVTTDIKYSQPYDPHHLPYIQNEVFNARSGYNMVVDLNVDLTGTGLALRKDNLLAVKGFGGMDYRPSYNFHYYKDASNAIYIEGMKAWLKGDAAYLYVENSDPHYMWLDYVPNVLTNNSDSGYFSDNAYMQVTQEPSKPDFWCMALAGPSNECPNTPIWKDSIQNLFIFTGAK